MTSEQVLRIGEVAARAGVSRRTVDFYTRLGLLRTVGRTEGNYRLYGPEAVEQIRLVRRLEQQGVSLEQVARLLARKPRRDLERELDLVDRELHALRRAVRAMPAGGATAGAIHALAGKLRAVVETALEVAGGGPPPL